MSKLTVADSPGTSPNHSRVVTLLSLVFVAIFGLFLSAFPARNADVLQHLAWGRNLIQHAQFHSTWLYDLCLYGLFQIGGGTATVAMKSIAISILGIVLFSISRTGPIRWIPLVATVLALMAVSSRVLLQPSTFGYLLLSLLIGTALTSANQSNGIRRHSRWYILAVLIVWFCIDLTAIVGIVVLIFAGLGRWIDEAKIGSAYARRRAKIAIAILTLSAAIGILQFIQSRNNTLITSESTAMKSPFQLEYFKTFADNPAALSFFPLLGLSALAIILNRSSWRWQQVLPWTVLALIASSQARAIPYFAIVAGPILAWSLQDWFARRAQSNANAVTPRWQRLAVSLLSVLIAIGFIISAWTGWLRGAPYGPRQWGFDFVPGIERAASQIREWHRTNRIAPNSRTLHLSPESTEGFEWYCPEDAIASESQSNNSQAFVDANEELRRLGVSRVIASFSDPKLKAVDLQFFLDQPRQWPIQFLSGGVVIFGWNDPKAADRSQVPSPIDFHHVAFRPSGDEKVLNNPAIDVKQAWTDLFWKTTPPRTGDREDANFLLLLTQAEKNEAAAKHVLDWEVSQRTSMVGTSFVSPISAMAFDGIVRGDEPPSGTVSNGISNTVGVLGRTSLIRQFSFERGDVSTAKIYLAIQAARRAVIANPQDAVAHLLLGQAYQRLLIESIERSWASRMPFLSRLRQIQISTALGQAVTLNPGLLSARLEFARHLQKMGCHDVALTHLQAYRDGIRKAGGAASKDSQFEAINKEVESLNDRRLDRIRDYQIDASRLSVADRAYAAVQRGLAGQALDTLLASDFSAFGVSGIKLELDLMLRMGRAPEVRQWMMSVPELKSSLGEDTYFWYLVQANAGLGDYQSAIEFLTLLSGSNGKFPPQRVIAADLSEWIGRVVLSDMLGSSNWPNDISIVLSRNDFTNRLTTVNDKLSLLANTLALRSLVHIEVGENDSARETLNHILTYFNPEKLEFNARPVAETCLGWIESASKPAKK